MEEIDYDQIRENLKKDSVYTEKAYTGKKTKTPKKGVYVLAAIVIAAVFLFALVRPAVIGYSVYGNVKKSGLATNDYSLNVESLNNRLKETETSLMTCTEQKSQAEAALAGKDSEIESVGEDLDEIKEEVEKRNEQIRTLNEKNSEIETELEEEKNNYSELLKNSARTICCKEKVDNENIDFYIVEDGKITCSEESGEELKCW